MAEENGQQILDPRALSIDKARRISTDHLSQQARSNLASLKGSNVAGDLLPVPGIQFEASKDLTFGDRKRMLEWTAIDYGLRLIKAPIVNANWSVEASSGEVREFVEQVIRPQMGELLRKALIAIEWGHAPMEQIWAFKDVKIAGRKQPIKRALVQSDFIGLPPFEVTYLKNPQTRRVAGFEWSLGGKKKSNIITPGSGKEESGSEILVNNELEWKALWHTHDLEAQFGNPYGKPALDKLFRPYVEAENGAVLWHIYMQSKANPLLFVTAPEGIVRTDDDEQITYSEYFMKLLGDQIGDGIFVLPQQVSEGEGAKELVDARYLTDNPRNDLYQSWMEAKIADMWYGIGLPGLDTIRSPNDITQLLKAQVQQNYFDAALTSINQLAVEALVRFNFGSKHWAYIVGKDLTGKRIEQYERIIQFAVQFLSRQRREEVIDRMSFDRMLDEMGIPQTSEEEQKEFASSAARIAAGAPEGGDHNTQVAMTEALKSVLDQSD